jgi:hypothetical protein
METAENPRIDHAIYVTDTGSVLVKAEPAKDDDRDHAPASYADLAAKYAATVAAMKADPT